MIRTFPNDKLSAFAQTTSAELAGVVSDELGTGKVLFGTDGSWTPVLTFVTPGDLAVTYAAQTGTYMKIGNRCIIEFYVYTSAFTHTTAAGQLKLTGLPVTAIGTFYSNINYIGINKAGYTDISAVVANGTTAIAIEACGVGAAPVVINAADCPTGGTMGLRGQIIITF